MNHVEWIGSFQRLFCDIRHRRSRIKQPLARKPQSQHSRFQTFQNLSASLDKATCLSRYKAGIRVRISSAAVVGRKDSLVCRNLPTALQLTPIGKNVNSPTKSANPGILAHTLLRSHQLPRANKPIHSSPFPHRPLPNVVRIRIQKTR